MHTTSTTQIEQHAKACDDILQHLSLQADWQDGQTIANALELRLADTTAALRTLCANSLATARLDAGRLIYRHHRHAARQIRARIEQLSAAA